MSRQLRISGIDPRRELKPDRARQTPVVWISRLQIRRSLAAGDEHVIRDIELRRGLNIIWAPPADSEEENALFRSGVGGHTAGKTTLCRFIRFALGEGSFATESTRQRIRLKIHGGWIAAEAQVGGRLWAIARPFAVGPHPRCVEDGSIDDMLADGADDRRDYQAFLDAVRKATTSTLPARNFPARGEAVQWEHILPWLSRDQECRFSDFLDWRHASTHSDAPGLHTDERQFVVRSVLGLITDRERAEQKRNAELLAKKKQAERLAPLLAHQATVDHQRVQEALDQKLPPPSSDLFGEQSGKEVQRHVAELKEKMRALEEADRRAEFRQVLEERVAAEANARRDVEEAATRLGAEQLAVQQLAPRAAGEGQAALLASLPPARDYCNVPMALAREQGCPIAAGRPLSLERKRSERTAAEALEAQQQIVQALEAQARSRQAALKTAQQATRKARKAYTKAATAYVEKRERLLKDQSRLDHISRLVDNAAKAWKQSEKKTATIDKLAKDIDASYKQQVQLRQEANEALGRFSSTFEHVVRALLGDQVTARVEAAGRGLSLSIDDNGERDSAALETLKLWAFDLAALTDSIEGHGHFPRFLLHDGPREGDIAADLYERLFLYARQLESCFDGEPNFQYIVTTTTPAPVSLAKEPWLRLQISGAPAEQRLLTMNL